jgi:DNA-directed RNA polymerase sigma subunit (sigma70/sigma32)
MRAPFLLVLLTVSAALSFKINPLLPRQTFPQLHARTQVLLQRPLPLPPSRGPPLKSAAFHPSSAPPGLDLVLEAAGHPNLLAKGRPPGSILSKAEEQFLASIVEYASDITAALAQASKNMPGAPVNRYAARNNDGSIDRQKERTEDKSRYLLTFKPAEFRKLFGLAFPNGLPTPPKSIARLIPTLMGPGSNYYQPPNWQADYEASLLQHYRHLTHLNLWSRNTIVSHNLGLVSEIVSQHVDRVTRFQQLSKNTREELRTEGVFGLIRAAEKFRTSHNVKFSTYAAHWIHARIRLQMHQVSFGVGNGISVPTHREAILHKARTLKRDAKQNGEAFHLDEVATAMNVDPGVLSRVMNAKDSAVELDAPLVREGTVTRKDMLCQRSDLSAEADFDGTMFMRELKKGLKDAPLTKQEREIFVSRIGLDGRGGSCQLRSWSDVVDDVRRKLGRSSRSDCVTKFQIAVNKILSVSKGLKEYALLI